MAVAPNRTRTYIPAIKFFCKKLQGIIVKHRVAIEEWAGAPLFALIEVLLDAVEAVVTFIESHEDDAGNYDPAL